MSGSTYREWNAYLKGNTPENTYNYSYHRPMIPSSTDIPPQTQQSMNKLIIANSKAASVASNKKSVKQNQLPPLPSAAVIRGGKRSSGKRKSKGKSKTHKKKRQY